MNLSRAVGKCARDINEWNILNKESNKGELSG